MGCGKCASQDWRCSPTSTRSQSKLSFVPLHYATNTYHMYRTRHLRSLHLLHHQHLHQCLLCLRQAYPQLHRTALTHSGIIPLRKHQPFHPCLLLRLRSTTLLQPIPLRIPHNITLTLNHLPHTYINNLLKRHRTSPSHLMFPLPHKQTRLCHTKHHGQRRGTSNRTSSSRPLVIRLLNQSKSLSSTITPT